MIKLFTLILLYLPVAVPLVTTAGPIDITADMIKAGNMQGLAKMFSTTVEITLLNDENIYSSSQAQVILANFFKNNPVKSVSIVHRVNSNPNFRFGVLLLTTSSAAYRTSVSLKLVNGQFLINEIRIETEKKE